MNHVNVIGKLNTIGNKTEKERFFSVKTTATRINDVTEKIEKEFVIHRCVMTGRWQNALDTIGVGHEVAIEGRIVNDDDGSMMVMVNDFIIL